MFRKSEGMRSGQATRAQSWARPRRCVLNSTTSLRTCQLPVLHGHSGPWVRRGRRRLCHEGERSQPTDSQSTAAGHIAETMTRSVEDLIGPLNALEQKYAPQQAVGGRRSIHLRGRAHHLGGRIAPPFVGGVPEDSTVGIRAGEP